MAPRTSPHGFMPRLQVAGAAAFNVFKVMVPPAKKAIVNTCMAFKEGGTDTFSWGTTKVGQGWTLASSHPRVSIPMAGAVGSGGLSTLFGGTFFQIPAWLLSTTTGVMGSTLGFFGNIFNKTSKVLYSTDETIKHAAAYQTPSSLVGSVFSPIGSAIKYGTIVITGTGAGLAGLVGYDAWQAGVESAKEEAKKATERAINNDWMLKTASIFGLFSASLGLREWFLRSVEQTAKSK